MIPSPLQCCGTCLFCVCIYWTPSQCRASSSSTTPNLFQKRRTILWLFLNISKSRAIFFVPVLVVSHAIPRAMLDCSWPNQKWNHSTKPWRLLHSQTSFPPIHPCDDFGRRHVSPPVSWKRTPPNQSHCTTSILRFLKNSTPLAKWDFF